MTTTQLREAFYSTDALALCSTLSCLRKLKVEAIIEAQTELVQYAPYSIEGIPLAEGERSGPTSLIVVIRPTYDTTTIPYDPTPQLFNNPNSLYLPPSNVPLLITTTLHEGGSAVQQAIPVALQGSLLSYTTSLATIFGTNRTQAIVDAYELEEGADSLRQSLEKVATDGMWRCPNRAVASQWAAAGGKVWVGEWSVGSTYPDNKGTYCQQSGRACHEDDLYPTFGTSPSPNSDVKAMVSGCGVAVAKANEDRISY